MKCLHSISNELFCDTYSWRSIRLVKILYHLFIAVSMAMPTCVQCRPSSPVNCAGNGVCTVSSTYGVWPDRSLCMVAKVVYPQTEVELIQAVANGVKNKMKMKVISKYAHSIPKLVCPGGDEGLLISTRDYANNIIINQTSHTVTADSGVELRVLVDKIADSGLALPHSPYWDGLSIGGILSTGAHGSSLWGKGSAVHEYVVGMSLVIPTSPEEGYAKLITLTEKDEELNAAKVSIGVLGVISRVTLALQPMFRRSVTNSVKSDVDLEDKILPFAQANEFGDVTWHPSMKQAVYRVDNRVPVEAAGNGLNDYVGFRSVSTVIVEADRADEELYELTNNPGGKCGISAIQVRGMLAIGTGLKNNGTFFGYPVIGDQNLIQTTGTCQNAPDDNPIQYVCPWDHRVKGLFFHQTTVSIPLTKIRDFILDVKKLRDGDPKSLCGIDLYDGFLMRYVRNSSAYLGQTFDAIDIDITYYRASQATTPRLNEDVLEEIEQLALFKYQALPHWGKNRHVGFLGAAAKYPNLDKFLAVKQRYDPGGLFSSEWSDAVLGILTSQTRAEALSINKYFCALEGLCICSADVHCAPKKRYFCRPGKVYPDARVCRYETN